jgi:hypothetical protein
MTRPEAPFLDKVIEEAVALEVAQRVRHLHLSVIGEFHGQALGLSASTGQA